MHRLLRTKLCILALAILATGLIPAMGVRGQEPELALVTSKGTGTVYTRPTHVVFRIHESVSGDTMEAAIKASADLGEALRAFVTDNELRPSSMDISTPAIVSVEGNLVRTSAELQFSMTPYAAGEAGAAKLGALCDQIIGFASGRGCEVAKPDFVTTETATVIQDAVQQATKDAYTAAVGAASALGGNIRVVDTVEIGDIAWNEPPDSEIAYPAVDQIACTAEVRLTYLLDFP